MFGILFKLIFAVIMKLAQLILTPIILLFSAAFPFIGDVVVNIVNFFNYIFTYVPTVLHLLCIPQTAVSMFFDFLIAYYAFYLGGLAYLFVMRMYRLLKP